MSIFSKRNVERKLFESNYIDRKNEVRDFLKLKCSEREKCLGCYFAVKNGDFIFCALEIAEDQALLNGSTITPQGWNE